jgi:hypothetical protein
MDIKKNFFFSKDNITKMTQEIIDKSKVNNLTNNNKIDIIKKLMNIMNDTFKTIDINKITDNNINNILQQFKIFCINTTLKELLYNNNNNNNNIKSKRDFILSDNVKNQMLDRPINSRNNNIDKNEDVKNINKNTLIRPVIQELLKPINNNNLDTNHNNQIENNSNQIENNNSLLGNYDDDNLFSSLDNINKPLIDSNNIIEDTRSFNDRLKALQNDRNNIIAQNSNIQNDSKSPLNFNYPNLNVQQDLNTQDQNLPSTISNQNIHPVLNTIPNFTNLLKSNISQNHINQHDNLNKIDNNIITNLNQIDTNIYFKNNNINQIENNTSLINQNNNNLNQIDNNTYLINQNNNSYLTNQNNNNNNVNQIDNNISLINQNNNLNQIDNNTINSSNNLINTNNINQIFDELLLNMKNTMKNTMDNYIQIVHDKILLINNTTNIQNNFNENLLVIDNNIKNYLNELNNKYSNFITIDNDINNRIIELNTKNNILKKTEFLQLVVSNKDNNSSYIWDFNQAIDNIISIKLISYSLPIPKYNINKNINNLIKILINNDEYDIIIPIGYYTINNLLKIINEKLTNIIEEKYNISTEQKTKKKTNKNTNYILFSLDEITQKIKITSNLNIDLLQTPLLNINLGFININKNNNEYISDNIWDLRTSNKVYLFLKNLSEEIPFGILYFNDINICNFKFSEPITLNNLEIYFLDENSNQYNFYNLHHELNFIIEKNI